MTENIFDILIKIINKLGYAGIFAATGLEYACFPISSELLLPFIGYTVSKGGLSLILTIITSTLAGVLGSLFCYFLGRFGGRFIDRTLCQRFQGAKIGIDTAKRHFNKYGNRSVLLARVFPIARTYISIPAGMSRMPISSFVIYTGVGALVWNTILISTGYYMGEHWSEAGKVISENKIYIYIAVTAIIIMVIYLLIKFNKNKISKI